MEKGQTMKNTGTITITLKLRGEPAAVVAALANGLPVDALEGIRDGMTAELEARRKRPARGKRRVTIRGRART
jgi:hypothetical protein